MTVLYEVFLEESGGQFHQGYWASDIALDNINLAQIRHLEELTKLIPITKDSIILDIGCGSGVPAIWLAKKFGCRIHAIDIAKENVARARQAIENEKLEHLIHVHHMDALEMDFKANFFDCAIAVEVIYQIEDKKSLFKEVKRVLKSEGHIAFSEFVLEPCSWLSRQIASMCVESKYMVSTNDYYEMLNNTELKLTSATDVTEETLLKAFEFGKHSNYDFVRRSIRKAYGLLVYYLTSFVYWSVVVNIPKQLVQNKTLKLKFISASNSN